MTMIDLRMGVRTTASGSARSAGRARRTTATSAALRVLGAAAMLVVGGVHLQQDLGAGYLHVPTIGVLFLLNFAGGLAVGVGLLLPLRRLAGRWEDRALDALASLGIAVAAGALAALLYSQHHALFGFRQTGYRTAIVVAIASEAAAVIALAGLLVVRHRGPAVGRRR